MPEQEAAPPPRAFISYSWTSPTHQSWVVELATRLREDGVDAILDVWDLKPGHDAIQFMERMVVDPSVNKVVLISDRAYCQKADARSGGVGTESQIISPEIYARADVNKYAAAPVELDEEGKPCIPTFFKGKVYIDFTDSSRYDTAYEELLRWILDKPLHVKPPVGAVPEHIRNPAAAASGTASKARRAEEALRNGSPQASGFLAEYTDAFVAELASISPFENPEEPDRDGAIEKAIAASQPYVTQFLEVAGTALRFWRDPALLDRLGQFFEAAGFLMFRPPQASYTRESDFDHHRFVVMELFLCTMALALREERFDLATSLLDRAYLISNADTADRATSGFDVFFQHIASLDRLRRREGRNLISPQADMLIQRHQHGAPSAEEIIQADFVCWIRAAAAPRSIWWPPVTVLYAARRRPFPIFARSESSAYFARVASLLGVKSADSLREVISTATDGQNRLRLGGGWPPDVGPLANLGNLAVLP